jgi:putative hydrolase of the HAD superfamily
MPAYRAVLFDFFGTLTYAVRRGTQHSEIARVLGCDPTDLVSVLDRSFYPRACGWYGGPESTLRWVCQQLGLNPEPERLRAALSTRTAAVVGDITLRPEAGSVLWALRRCGLRTALVSDCVHELPALLPRLPIAPLLDACVFSVDIGQCKPHPAMYLAACARLGVAPAECVYVGDGGSHELTGAAAVGMTAVWLASADLASHLVFNADNGWDGPTVTSLVQIPDLVTACDPAFLHEAAFPHDDGFPHDGGLALDAKRAVDTGRAMDACGQMPAYAGGPALVGV